MLSVRRSISTKTGWAPVLVTALAVETKVNEGMITSSPGPSSHSMAAISSAAVQELVIKPPAAPEYSLSHSAACWLKGPSEARLPCSITRVTYSSSFPERKVWVKGTRGGIRRSRLNWTHRSCLIDWQLTTLIVTPAPRAARKDHGTFFEDYPVPGRSLLILLLPPRSCSLGALAVLFCLVGRGQAEPVPKEPVVVGSWNLEWFFDADPADNRSPLARQQSAPSEPDWIWKRDAVADVIGKMAPTILALQEVENRQVLVELAEQIKK